MRNWAQEMRYEIETEKIVAAAVEEREYLEALLGKSGARQRLLEDRRMKDLQEMCGC